MWSHQTIHYKFSILPIHFGMGNLLHCIEPNLSRLDLIVTTNSNDTYRFGFNGQEKDDEVAGAGNINTAFDWEYDTRLGHRWNIDPMIKKYPGWSPYCVMNSNPILKNDPTGESGVVTIDNKTKTITISSTMVFYGGDATLKNAQAASNEIADQWNRPNTKITIEGQVYSVQVKIHYQVVTEEKAIEMANNNKDASLNFIRVEKTTDLGSSYMRGVGTNSGFWQTNDNFGTSTSAAHEFGHGLGLLEGWEHNKTDGIDDARGQGQPGVMARRGTMVDAAYTWNPRKGNSTPTNNNFVNPSSRRVTLKNIMGIITPSIVTGLISNGKANIGTTNNIIMDKNGKKIN